MHLSTEKIGGSEANATHLGIGEGAVQRNGVLVANLGSCLGIAIGWPEAGVFGLVHALMPTHPGGRDKRLTRYADTAVQYLLESMEVRKRDLSKLSAVIAGGAAMYTSANRVGEKNATSGRAALRRAGIRVVGMDVGGHDGRRIYLDCQSGRARSIRLNQQAEVTEWMIRPRVRR